MSSQAEGCDEEEEEREHDDVEEIDLERENLYGPYASFEKSASENKIFESMHKTTQLIFKKKSGKMITRLKQPRDLYALSKQRSSQLNPRWPAEVQVLAQRPNHIEYVSNKLEVSYKPIKDTKPPPRSSDIFGKVVYDNSPNSEVKYFTRSKVSSTIPKAKPFYGLQGPDDNTLLFESRFESGNLMRAIKLGEYDYELWLRFDLYTKKHTQWYYFQIRNAKPSVQYRFTIMNFIKPGSLYNEGMRPLMYSKHDAKTKGVGWTRVGAKIRYYKNDIKFVDRNKERNYYSLTWSCSFPNDNDTYYFAHCYPYTYSDLQEHLAMLADDPARSRCFKQRVLCRTLAGNLVHVLTITAPTRRRAEAELKKAIVITARVHPGETNSSWMMKGFIDFLTSNLQDAKILRDNFIFKIVPMLNPDGVIVGNYRCSLAGRDLNRNYKTVLKESFPSIWHTRAMIKKLQEEREVLVYCDLHGHSRKKNVFIYGCEGRSNKSRRFWERVFPMMLSKNSQDKFTFKSCRFKVQKSREGTGRIFMWNVGIPYSFTMEASFFGSSLGKRKGSHFNIADYQSMAYHFCDTLLDFCDPDDSKFHAILAEIEKLLKSVILEKMIEANSDATVQNINLDENLDLLSELELDSGGSDSSISDGLPMQLLHASVPELSRRKRLKTRKERNRSLSKQQNDVTPAQPPADRFKVSVSAKGSDSRSEHKIINRSPNSAKIGRTSYKKRDSSQGLIDAAPHFIKDRMQGQGKLKREYLETLTNSFMNSGTGDIVDLKDIPHCRYTAGISSLHQQQKACLTCERCCKSLSDGSDEDVRYVTYKNQGGNQSYPDVPAQLYGSETSANTVLDLAKRITVYNHRRNQILSKGSNPRAVAISTSKSRQVLQRVDDFNVNQSTDWVDWHDRRSSMENHQFLINREERLAAAGPQHSRINNHFELQKHASNTSKNKISISPNERIQSRRLPELRKTSQEDTPCYFEGKESSSGQQFEHDNQGLRDAETSYQPQNSKKAGVRKTYPITATANVNFNDKEIDVIKKKMQASGATGSLLNYVLSSGNSKKSPALMDKKTEAKDMKETKQKIGNPDSEKKHPYLGPQTSNRDAIEKIVEKERSFVVSKTDPANYLRAGSFHGFRDVDQLAAYECDVDLGCEGGFDASQNQLYVSGNERNDADSNQLGGQRPRISGSNTNADLQTQGLVTLNVNLNISPVVYENPEWQRVNQNYNTNPDPSDQLHIHECLR